MHLLHEALAGAFRDHAVRCAIREEGSAITYGALAELTAKAARLVAELWRGDDRFVGLSVAVTGNAIAAAIGILLTGRAYVPLDVQSPPARLAEIIANARLRVLLIDPLAYPDWAELTRGSCVTTVVLLGADPKDAPKASSPPESSPGPRSLLSRSRRRRRPSGRSSRTTSRILYTSGSTGVPKGVMLSHRNARTFVDWMAAEFAITANDRIASRAPLNFDLSVFDVFNTLAAGATLLIKDRCKAAEAGRSSAERHRAYVDMLRSERATVLYTTPSTFVTLVEKGGLDASVPLRVIMYAGEPFPPALLRKVMAALPRTRVANIFPIVSVWCGDNDRLIETSRILLDAGVLLTLGPYPMIPKGKEELRITITARNTEEQVNDHLLRGFARVRDHLARTGAPLRPANSPRGTPASSPAGPQ